ncbi:MAG: GNAT family N-acetyltransferase [Bacteroidota bacterium]
MVNYRLALEEDYSNINDFYNRIHGLNRSIDVFYWEFHNCPFGKSIYVIAEDGNKIVGTNCVIPIDLVCSDNSIIKSGKSEDTLVDPDYRGQNIFNNIYDFLFEKCKENGIKVIWGYTPAKKPFLKLGFSIPFDHKQSLVVNKLFKSYTFLSSLNKKNTKVEKAKIFGLCLFSKLKMISFAKNRELNDYTLIENQKITKGVDELIQSNLNSLESGFAINQIESFQDWRIYQNPNFFQVHTYGFYDKNNVLKALFVLNSHSNKVAYFCQSTFSESMTNKERIKMIKYVTKKMFNNGIVMIRNWHFDHTAVNKNEIHNFKNSNFTFLDRGISFVWKNLEESIEIDSNKFILSRISTQGVI